MKILLIGFTKIGYMPYMNFYLKQLAKPNNEIHLLYWNRDEKEEAALSHNVTVHEFRLYQEDEVAKVKKIKSFLKYRKNAKQLLLCGKFDFVIVMHSIPGVLLYDVLKKYYSSRYVLDYRDVTFERIGLFKRVVHKLVVNSAATFVSSDAFRDYLPLQDNIYTTHNILLDSLEHRNIRCYETRYKRPIRIRYWGFIRHENINKTVIDRLANDDRFELHYHGREQETAHNLKQHCKKNGIKNVFFHGEYKPEERYLFASETELIHNIYENNTTKDAMGNKYYDGITFYIPQLCNQGSFMGEEVTKNGIGLECNPEDEDLGNDIFEYYNTINWNTFEKNCDQEVVRIMKELDDGSEVLMTIEQRSSSI